MSTKLKYIAVKVEGVNHWFWFERAKTKEENGRFVGWQGWGKRGALTDLDIDAQLIKSRMESTDLQYEN